MKNELITTIEQAMLKKLDNAQLQALHEVLVQAFKGVSVTAVAIADKAPDNTEILEEFLSAKRIEGCSEKSLNYYRKTITAALDSIGKGIKHITTDDLRAYLTDYQSEKSPARSLWIISAVSFRASFRGWRTRTISSKVPFGAFTRSRQARRSKKPIRTKTWS